MRLRDLIKNWRRTKRVYQPAVPPGNPPGDFREWQRNRAIRNAIQRQEQAPTWHDKGRTQTSLAKKLEILSQLYPHPDGGQWTAQEIEEATNREIHPGYWLAMKEGRTNIISGIAQHGTVLNLWDAIEHNIRLITRAMGVPYDLWFRPMWWWEKVYEEWARGEDVEDKLHDEKYDSDENRPARLLVNWGYMRPTAHEWTLGQLNIRPRNLRARVPAWTLCSVEEAAELLQIPEVEVEEMLNTGELQGGQADAGSQGVNLHSVLDRVA